jgi:hypothetical protein
MSNEQALAEIDRLIDVYRSSGVDECLRDIPAMRYVRDRIAALPDCPSPARDKVLEEALRAIDSQLWQVSGKRKAHDLIAALKDIEGLVAAALKSQPPSTMGEDAPAGEFVMVPRAVFDAEYERARTGPSSPGLSIMRVLKTLSDAAAPKPTQPIGLDEREKIARELFDWKFGPRWSWFDGGQSRRREAYALADRIALSAGEVAEAIRLVLVESNILDPGEKPALSQAIKNLSALHERLTGKDNG